MTDRPQMPDQPKQQAKSGGQEPGQAGVTPDLGLHLQQEIEQAIQPILADFRAQVESSVAQQVQSEVRTRANGQGAAEDSGKVLQSGSAQTDQEGAGGSGVSGPQQTPSHHNASAGNEQAGGRQESDQAQPSGNQGSRQASNEGQPPNPPSAPESSGEGEHEPGGQSGGAGSALVRSGAFQVAERVGEQALQALVVAGLKAVLSERTQAAAQEKGHEALTFLLAKMFDQLPQNETTQELRGQTEKTLSAILRDAINAVYADELRQEFERYGKEATADLMHGHVGEAGEAGKQALETLVQALIPVIRQEWNRLLRLLLKMGISALENMMTSPGEAVQSTADAGKSLVS